MPIPQYQSLMLPVLHVASDGKEHSLADFRATIASILNLSDEDRSERLPSATESVFSNRIAWAVQYLKRAELLKTVRRAVYRITERGQLLLKENPSEISAKMLRRYPEFVEFLQRTSSTPKPISLSEVDLLTAVPESTATPEESLE